MTETPKPIREAGLALVYEENGSRLVVKDASPNASDLRNRGGEAIARVLASDRNIKSLDLRPSLLTDNGVGHVCLMLRQTDQLEELNVSPVGHVGFEFLLGFLRRSTSLHTLRATVNDRESKVCFRHMLGDKDYNTSSYMRQKEEGEEEEEEEGEAPDAHLGLILTKDDPKAKGRPDSLLIEPPGEDEEPDPEKRELQKAAKLRQIFGETDADSGDEGTLAAQATKRGTSPGLNQLLLDFMSVVAKKDHLTTVELAGAAVPQDLQADLARVVAHNGEKRERAAQVREERGTRTAHDALKDQMEELCAGLDSLSQETAMPGEQGGPATRIGVRSFVGRRLVSALGEALFECQRFKSKENEAVSTAEGEMAFVAMHLRKLQAAALEERGQKRRGHA